jgi:mgtE-like transporter
LSFNIISLFAGGLLSIFAPQFQVEQWILALFPPILMIRGGIGGIFSGNLATMLHLGLVKPQLRGNTESYKGLVKSVLIITVLDTIILGVLSFIFNFVLGRVELHQIFIFLIVPTVACIFAVSVSIPLTSLIAIETFKRGLDPDILVYPILASINDVVVTSFFVLIIFNVLNGGFVLVILIVVYLIILCAVGYLGLLSIRDQFFVQTLKEGSFIVVISSLFGGINGAFLSGIGSSLSPGLVILYPALTNALGNIGSIIGSKTTTNMALGFARSFKEELKDAVKSIIQVEIPAAFMHVVFAIISFLISGHASKNNFQFLIAVALLSNLSNFLIISVFALYSAFLAFKRGLNPDNIVIPAITSVSDTVATFSMISAVMLFRLIG